MNETKKIKFPIASIFTAILAFGLLTNLQWLRAGSAWMDGKIGYRMVVEFGGTYSVFHILYQVLLIGSMILLAARAAGIDAIDTVYSDVNNEEGFRAEVELIHQLGFDGKSIINPRQIKTVHQVYTPTQKDIDKALAVMEAIEEAHRKGSGVISLNGKMVDRPIVLRAQRTLDLAKAAGIRFEEVAQHE